MVEPVLTGRTFLSPAIARGIYSGFLYLLLPFVFLKLAWRARHARDYLRDWPQRLGYFSPRGVIPDSSSEGRAPSVIWIHAVSFGEVQAAVPVVAALRRRYPAAQFFVSCTTPTGKARAKAVFGDFANVSYVPYDVPDAVKRFLSQLRPSVAIFMETELWPNLFHTCASRGIPVIVANARMSARSARGYQRVRWLTRVLWPDVTHIAAQSAADADRFRFLGAVDPRITVTGTVKFDCVVPVDMVAQGRALRQTWGVQRPVWVAASTHAGEDEMMLAAHAQVRLQFPAALLILVPRHPERFDAVASASVKAGYQIARRTGKDAGPSVEVYIGDTMGELPLYLAASDIAFVGGSLVPVGGHNLLEPASLGIPVITGPHTFNFVEVVSLLKHAQALRCVDNASQLADAVAAWFSDPEARTSAGAAGNAAVAAHRGATERLIELIDQIWSQRSPVNNPVRR